MAIYVDDMYKNDLGNFGNMKMSHMIADSTQELLDMATKIGVAQKWIQSKGKPTEHFDICISKRKLAIEYGAIEVGMRILAPLAVHRESCNHKIKINETNSI